MEESDQIETEEIEYPDGQRVIVDGIGISHFIMPRRCKTGACDD